MAFRLNAAQQLSLTDEFNRLSPRTKRIVENSFAKDFADIVFPAINEERFSVLYSNNPASRSNTPVNFIVGALMLKTMTGQSDDEMLEAICCDVRYKYALHTTSYEEQPISDRTFSRFRERLYNHELKTGEKLLEDEMKALSTVYQKFLSLHSNIKRMDSMMIASSAKRMSRLEIIYTVNANCVKLMHQLGADDQIPAGLEHYLSEEDHNDVIYYCKDDDVIPRLEKVIREAEQIQTAMGSDQWIEFSQYQLLIRVLSEQTIVAGDGTRTAKPKEEISPSSLQNPSDPDAAYRKKAGKDNKGYVGNFVETVGEDGVSLITDFDLQPNTYSDTAFCKDQIGKHDPADEEETWIADGAYGSTEIREMAKNHNIKLVTTALTGKNPHPHMAGFLFDETGMEVLQCPAGNVPSKCTYYPKREMFRIIMEKSHCSTCPHKDKCNVRLQHNTCAVMVSAKMVQRAKYLKLLSSEEYKGLTRMRNAVEGIPSVLRRKYHIDESPFLDIVRRRWVYSLVVGAYNTMKLIRHLPKVRAKSALNPTFA